MAKKKVSKRRKVKVLGKAPTGKITTARRKQLVKTKKTSYAIPSKAKLGPKGGAPRGAYPIDTPERARAALHYAAMWHGKNSSTYRQVRAKVCKKYPDFPICGKGKRK